MKYALQHYYYNQGGFTMKPNGYQLAHFLNSLVFSPLIYKGVNTSIAYTLLMIILINIPSVYLLKGNNKTHAAFQVLWDLSVIIVFAWLFR